MATKQEIIDYVMTTPSNPNKAVLEGMLEDTSGTNVPTPTVEDAGKVLGVGDNGKYVLEKKGFTCTEEATTLTEESVTTEGETNAYGEISYSEYIDADAIYITFNGVKYTCSKRFSEEYGNEYGAPYDETTSMFDWSQYPFYFASVPNPNRDSATNTFVTETAGTHSIKIEAVEETIETTACFEKAVRKVADTGFTCAEVMTVLTDESVTTETSHDISAGALTYTEPITADAIKVTFDGVEYTCQNEADRGNRGLYGDISGDFAEYPFTLESSSTIDIATGSLNIKNILYTKTAGTHDITIETNALTVIETTECFSKAVNQVVEMPEAETSSKVIINLTAVGESEESSVPTRNYPVQLGFGAPSFSDIFSNFPNTEYYVVFDNTLMRITEINSSQVVFTAFKKVTVTVTNGATVERQDQIRHYVFVWNANSTSYAVNTYDIEIPSAYN